MGAHACCLRCWARRSEASGAAWLSDSNVPYRSSWPLAHVARARAKCRNECRVICVAAPPFHFHQLFVPSPRSKASRISDDLRIFSALLRRPVQEFQFGVGSPPLVRLRLQFGRARLISEEKSFRKRNWPKKQESGGDDDHSFSRGFNRTDNFLVLVCGGGGDSC